MAEKKEDKPQAEVKNLFWKVEPVPTEFQPALVKGEEALKDANAALAKILNDVEEIKKVLGQQS